LNQNAKLLLENEVDEHSENTREVFSAQECVAGGNKLEPMNVCVFCSSNDLAEKYRQPVSELAKLLAESGHCMIYGGSDYGLMKLMADGMQQGGAKVVGVTIPIYAVHARKSADEIVVANTLGERKATILERSDVVVVLPGGLGTLDEMTEILELKRQNHHDKLIVVLDIDGFYEGFRTQLGRIAEENMFKAGENTQIRTKTLDEFILFVNTPADVIELLDSPSLHDQKVNRGRNQ
jgi:uncharacterized protein (TIGR00730 family)